MTRTSTSLAFASLVWLLSLSCGGPKAAQGARTGAVIGAGLGLFLLMLLFNACTDTPGEQADTIYLNGKIYTVNEAQPWAEAVAIKDGKFLKVGTNPEVEALRGGGTEMVDLEGKFAMPGIHDVHIHTLDIESEIVNGDLSLPPVSSKEELLSIIESYAKANPDKEWIAGGPYPMLMFPNENAPKELLDEIVPDRPVAILHQTGHALWVNSKALEIAGITAETEDPPLGLITRKEDSNEPAGTLKEAAQPLIMKYYMVKTPEIYEETVRSTSRFYNERGVTSVRAATGRIEHWEALRKIDLAGELNLRFLMGWNWSTSLIEPKPEDTEIERRIRENLSTATAHARCNGLKIFMDGGFDSHTAALFEHYTDEPTTKGILNINRDYLFETTKKMDELGVSILYHCIGDSAATVALDAIAYAREMNGSPGTRHQISHSALILEKDIQRVMDLGVSMDFSPILPLSEALKAFAEKYIGTERLNRVYPGKWAFEAGAGPGIGSDHNVSPVEPFGHMEILISRGDPYENIENVIAPDQAITIEQAIRGYTLNGAYVMMQEDVAGSIEEGKFADFIVLDRNLLETPTADLSETKVLSTVFEGKLVYSSN